MWKLTITRKYRKTYSDGTVYDTEAVFEYESDYMEHLVDIIERTNDIATNGTYEYKIVWCDGEEE